MFSWFRRKPPATTAHADGGALRTAPSRFVENPANPGVAPRGTIRFPNRQREWVQEFDAVRLLARTLMDDGHTPRVDGDVVVEESTGLSLRPLLARFEPVEGRGVQTVTTIELKHPTLVPAPVFEYQHATGDTLPASIQAGFDQWCKTDLVALADATRAQPRHCTLMVMDLPAKDGRPAMKRRLVLGPVAHVQHHPRGPARGEGEDGHPFCPCCLTTRSLEAFLPLIQVPGFFGLRLFAMRNEQGDAAADCRVNGEDFLPGQVGLARYVSTWPGEGFEFRKQYVVIQDAPAIPTGPESAGQRDGAEAPLG